MLKMYELGSVRWFGWIGKDKVCKYLHTYIYVGTYGWFSVHINCTYKRITQSEVRRDHNDHDNE